MLADIFSGHTELQTDRQQSKHVCEGERETERPINRRGGAAAHTIRFNSSKGPFTLS